MHIESMRPERFSRAYPDLAARLDSFWRWRARALVMVTVAGSSIDPFETVESLCDHLRAVGCTNVDVLTSASHARLADGQGLDGEYFAVDFAPSSVLRPAC
jgi:hypothetical protein